ncbi:GTP pyrophosphokinase family protein [Candidatus Saccharibacteria bacterium]|nr:GTP pyrophosphokinase family protein [Candidatus Saccharibacteria bacterium]
MQETEKSNLNLLTEEDYEALAIEYEDAMNKAMASIEIMDRSMERSEGRNPFEQYESRIKEYGSVEEKCGRKGHPFTLESVKKNILDIAGIRITTAFRDDIYRVVEILHQFPDFVILDEKDYVKNPKPNGYSSYHLHIEVNIFYPGFGSKKFPIEIQIRDKAMDFWATIEHSLKYKNANLPEEKREKIEKMFRELADALTKVEEKAIKLRDS